MGAFRESLSLDWLFFRCRQLRTVNLPKWQIWGWHILVPFRRKMGGRGNKEGGKVDRGKKKRNVWIIARRIFNIKNELSYINTDES